MNRDNDETEKFGMNDVIHQLMVQSLITNFPLFSRNSGTNPASEKRTDDNC